MRKRIDLLREAFTHEVSKESKPLLIAAIESSIKHFVMAEKPIYLEGFGIIKPTDEKTVQSVAEGDKNIQRSIKRRRLNFQKCSEITSFTRTDNPQLVEERDFAAAVFSHLPIDLQIEWDYSNTRKYLRGFFEFLKHETISQGTSKSISRIGDFYALHNRQGRNLNDWYAGSNIVFKSNFDREIACEECKVYEKPVLNDGWELLECLYGKPIYIFNFDPQREAKALGFELEPASTPVRIGVFSHKIGAQQQLIYCSEGMRHLAKDSTLGKELVFQVVYDADYRESAKNSSFKLDDMIVADWPKTVFAVGWVLLKSSHLAVGSGFDLNEPLCPDLPTSRLSAVLATKFTQAPAEQMAVDGRFQYINLVGITDSEYRLAESHNVEHLVVLLRSKRLDQITKTGRISILFKTSFLDLPPSGMRQGQVSSSGHLGQSSPEARRQAPF